MRNILTQAKYAASAFAPLDWLVVTDEYPPEAVGGAEISLHEILSSLSADCGNGIVVKFTGISDNISTYRYEGVRVVVLPQQANWRVPGISKMAYQRQLAWGRPRWLFFAVQGAKLLARFGLETGRVHALLMAIGKAPAGGVLTDHLPETYQLQASALNALVEVLQPGTVIANNTRSIMTVHRAHSIDPGIWRETHRVAMVRDNRFFCARANQIGRIDGEDCQKCTRDCAASDAGKERESWQRSLLQRSGAARREALENFDQVAVTSQFLRNQIMDVSSVVAPSVVPNFAGHPERIYQKIAHIAQTHKPVLLIVGSINEAKGQLEFLRNSLPFLAENERLEVHFVGRGQRLQKAMEAICVEHGITNRIRFRGFLDRDKLYVAIRQATVVVLPTLWEEPFGRVPLEAAACGRPVVAFESGGLVELVDDRRTGLLVPKGDYGALWTAISSLLADGQLRHQLASAAQQDFNERFCHRRCVTAFASLIRPPKSNSADERSRSQDTNEALSLDDAMGLAG